MCAKYYMYILFHASSLNNTIVFLYNIVHLICISHKIQSESYYCFLKIVLEINKVSMAISFIRRAFLRIRTKTNYYATVWNILLRKRIFSGLIWSGGHLEKWSSKGYYYSQSVKKLVIFTDFRKNTAVILFTQNHKKRPKVYDASFILSSHSDALICST